jgi:ribosomal protein S18 acetylase RimI-like enzyme
MVAVMDDTVIGSVMAGYDGHRGWVNYLAVSPTHQRRGIARQLMTRVEEELLAIGCPKLNLQVRDSNEEALRFYAALGYVVDPAVSLGKRLIPDGI